MAAGGRVMAATDPPVERPPVVGPTPRARWLSLVALGLALVVGSTVWAVVRADADFDAVERLGTRVTPADLRVPLPWLPIAAGLVGLLLLVAGLWRRLVPQARALRLALVVVGLAAALYGSASLTGGWLGTPPWWTATVVSVEPPVPETHFYDINVGRGPRPGRESISGAVIAVGVGLAAFGAWSRRRPEVL